MEPIAQVEIPEDAVVLREVRVVQYMDGDGEPGIAIGVEGQTGFDIIATLGLLTMATNLLLTDNGED